MESLGSVAVDCGKVTEQLSRDLAASGLHVTRSFDLQSARQALRDPHGCPCPHHGTADCTCQYVVLLVETGAGAPITLVAHGHDGETHLSADLVGTADSEAKFIRTSVKGLAMIAPVET